MIDINKNFSMEDLKITLKEHFQMTEPFSGRVYEILKTTTLKENGKQVEFPTEISIINFSVVRKFHIDPDVNIGKVDIKEFAELYRPAGSRYVYIGLPEK